MFVRKLVHWVINFNIFLAGNEICKNKSLFTQAFYVMLAENVQRNTNLKHLKFEKVNLHLNLHTFLSKKRFVKA